MKELKIFQLQALASRSPVFLHSLLEISIDGIETAYWRMKGHVKQRLAVSVGATLTG